MNPQILKPHPALRPYIKYYMYFEAGVKGKWLREGSSPTALPLLSIALGTNQMIYKERGCREPLMFASQFTKYTPMSVYGRTRIFNIYFHPAGAFQLLGISQKGLNNKIINLSVLLGSSAIRLKEMLAEQTTITGVSHLMESFFLRKLSLQKKYNSSRRLSYVIDQIALNTHRNNIIKEICLQEGYSISRLERHMQKMVGIGPKMIHRILRFNHVLRYINQNKSPYNWSQIAYMFGYHDQMHFIKEFNRFHGTTPGNLETIASKLQLSLGFSGETHSASSIFRVYK